MSLGGKLNVALSPGGRLNVGIYRVINYGGALSNPAALTLGTLPTGADRADYFIQTSVDKQVNLAYTNGLKLNYWDGGAGPRNNSHVDGGAGIWVAPGGVNDSWTDSAGTINAAWSQDAVAIFSGQGGTVLVDSTTNGPINAQAMQFAVDGYVLQGNGAGDKLTLMGTSRRRRPMRPSSGWARARPTAPAIRPPSRRCSTARSGWSRPTWARWCCRGQHLHRRHGRQRRHAAGLAGREPGRRGGRAVAGWRHADRDRQLRHGARHHAGRGRRRHQRRGGVSLGVTSAIGGNDTLTKGGAGTLTLHADNGHSGGTTISAGTLQLGTGGTTGSIAGDVANNGVLAFNRSDAYTHGGAIDGTGSVTQRGGGTTVLTADNRYTGGTMISAGALQLGAGGTTGSIVGDVSNNGALVFNRSDAYTFGGLVDGSGTLTQAGAGVTVLTADHAYTGGTTISAGTLRLGDGGASGSVRGISSTTPR